MRGVIHTDDSAGACLRGLPPGSVDLHDGFWSERMAANVRGMRQLGQRLEAEGVVDNFRRLGGRNGADRPRRGLWFTDSDLYKWVEAAAWILATAPASADRAAIAEQLDLAIDAVVAAQASDGYLNTAFADDRYRDLTTSHELYCAGHLFQAAIAHRRVTGDERLLRCAIRCADHLVAEFGPQGRAEADAHPGVEMALVELARETGAERYLALARFLVDLVDHASLRELGGHAVRAQYYACALEDLAIATGDTGLTADADRLWASLVETRSYVTGGVGGRWLGESVGRAYELPAESAYAETCAAAACVMWAWRRLQRTGDPGAADRLELTLHNALLVGVSLDGAEWSYVNPLADAASTEQDPWQHDLAGFNLWFLPSRRHAFHPVTCCPPNLGRLLASLPGYLYGTGGDDAWVHLYAPSQAHVGPLHLTVRTALPWEGTVELGIDGVDAAGTIAGRDGETTLHLRIPGWCASASASVNGVPVGAPIRAGSYLPLRRRWRPGDRVEVELPIVAELLVAHPRVADARGAVAVRRGPFVYCAEEVDQPGVDVLTVGLRADLPITSEPRDDLLGGVVAVRATGCAPDDPALPLYHPIRHPIRRPIRRAVELVLVPYWAWANRALGAMTVWLRRDDRAEPDDRSDG